MRHVGLSASAELLVLLTDLHKLSDGKTSPSDKAVSRIYFPGCFLTFSSVYELNITKIKVAVQLSLLLELVN